MRNAELAGRIGGADSPAFGEPYAAGIGARSELAFIRQRRWMGALRAPV